MATKAYIFLALNKEARVPFPDQKSRIEAFAAEIGLQVDEIFIENRNPLSLPFAERQEGAKIVASLQPGDTIICLQAEWILATLCAAAELLSTLRESGVSLYCVDLNENLSLDSKRKLVVSNGPASLIQQLLRALTLASEEPLVRVDELLRSETEYVAESERRRVDSSVEGQQGIGSKLTEEGAAPEIPCEIQANEAEDDVPRLVEALSSSSWQPAEDAAQFRERKQQLLLTEIHMMKEQGVAELVISQVLREKHGIWLSSEGIRKLLINGETAAL